MQEKWVAAWANAMSIAEHKPMAYAKNVTIRYSALAPFSARGVRMTFDNFCGTEAVTITRATAALGDGRRGIDETTLALLTFGGNQSVTIGAGETIRSDELSFEIKAGERLTVSFYLGDYTQMQSAVFVSGPLSGGWFAVGDHADCELPLEQSKTTSMVYFLSEIDFLTDARNRALVCFGDSITAQNWPDELALIANAQTDNRTAVVRRAASGCRILRQYSCLTYDSYGLKADVRFPHEFPMPGADTVIIQEGINDIIHPVGVEVNPFRPWEDLPTLEDLENGLRYCIDQVHGHGMKAYLGTLLPIGGWRTYAPFRNELRCALNDWMRTCPEADGCIDFDAAVRSPADPAYFDPACDSGDHLHPSKEGYRRMALAVPGELIR